MPGGVAAVRTRGHVVETGGGAARDARRRVREGGVPPRRGTPARIGGGRSRPRSAATPRGESRASPRRSAGRRRLRLRRGGGRRGTAVSRVFRRRGRRRGPRGGSLDPSNVWWCRGGCGGNVHARCMRMWIGKSGASACPLCRAPWIPQEPGAAGDAADAFAGDGGVLPAAVSPAASPGGGRGPRGDVVRQSEGVSGGNRAGRDLGQYNFFARRAIGGGRRGGSSGRSTGEGAAEETGTEGRRPRFGFEKREILRRVGSGLGGADATARDADAPARILVTLSFVLASSSAVGGVRRSSSAPAGVVVEIARPLTSLGVRVGPLPVHGVVLHTARRARCRSARCTCPFRCRRCPSTPRRTPRRWRTRRPALHHVLIPLAVVAPLAGHLALALAVADVRAGRVLAVHGFGGRGTSSPSAYSRSFHSPS